MNEKERKTLLKSFITEINRKYIIQIGYTKNINTEEYKNVWEKAILLTIDFLVSSDNYDYLFNEIFKIMEHFGQKNIFIANLEPFILYNRIKYMPNETLREVIYYYKDHNKPEVIQYLIINIDLESIDIGFLITLCIENQLYVPLMYICTRSDPPDFMTPLVKMFSEYKYRLEGKSSNSNSNEMGMKCLWFIDLTLRGKMFPDATIEVELWKTKVIETIIWSFDQQILSLLILVNPFIAFEIFYMIFDFEISNVIQTSNEKITIYSGSNVPTEHRNLLFGDIGTKNITLCDMITLIYESSIDIKEAQTLLYYFLAKMHASYDFPLKLNIVKEIIVYLLKNDKVVPEWTTFQSKKIGKKSVTLETILNESDEDDDVNEDYRVDLILVILRKLYGKLTKDDLEKFKDIVVNEPDL